MKERNDERLAVLVLVLGSVFYGFNNVLTKLALSTATPWGLLSMRFILALIPYDPCYPRKRKTAF